VLAGADRARADGPLPGDLVAGKYRVEKILGQGGMGRVLQAENVSTGKKVALKWVLKKDSDDARHRFAREARAAGRIHHPNVVDVYDVVDHDGATCLVMELLRGESLASLLAREGTLACSDAVAIALEVARGLAAAHREGVIHRDLKPGNLFLVSATGQSTRVKVLDFGISKIVEATPTDQVTNTGMVLGTPHYMSPEQVRGAKEIDRRVDVYALAAVLYEMLAGKPPFDHSHVTALLVDIATKDVVPVHVRRKDVPVELSAVIGRGLARERDDRFPDVESFARALEPFGDGTRFDTDSRDLRVKVATGDGDAGAASGRLSHASTVLATGPQPKSRRRGIAIAASVAIAIAGAAAIAWAFGGAGADPSEVATSPSTVPAATPPVPTPSEAARAAATEAPVGQPTAVVPASAPPVAAPDPGAASAPDPRAGIASEPAAAPERPRAGRPRPPRSRPEAPAQAEPARPEGATTSPRAGTLSLEEF
jgi:serine/threonine-protein kinase